MEEVYTCECGCQKWTIYDDRIECEECCEQYWIKGYIMPREFNKNRNEKKVEGGG